MRLCGETQPQAQSRTASVVVAAVSRYGARAATRARSHRARTQTGVVLDGAGVEAQETRSGSPDLESIIHATQVRRTCQGLRRKLADLWKKGGEGEALARGSPAPLEKLGTFIFVKRGTTICPELVCTQSRADTSFR